MNSIEMALLSISSFLHPTDVLKKLLKSIYTDANVKTYLTQAQ